MSSDTMSVSINVEEVDILDNFRQLTSEVKIFMSRVGLENGPGALGGSEFEMGSDVWVV